VTTDIARVSVRTEGPPVCATSVVGVPVRGCTLGVNFQCFKDRKSVIWGVWAAPGAPKELTKGGGRNPPPIARVSGVPGRGRPDPQNDRLPTFKTLQHRTDAACWTWLVFGRYCILKISVMTWTPSISASKINDFRGLFDDSWGVRGRFSRPSWGIPGVRAGNKNIYF
jgi:hypothetical protein